MLYSNRSASYASLRDFDKALEDANECVKINPSWAKGWGRKGAALFGQGDLVGAKDAYETAVEKDPSNALAANGLKSVNEAIEREASADGITPDMGMGKMFSDPQVLARLASNPKTKDFVKDPEFMARLQEVGSNPMLALQSATKDPRLMQAIAVALGIDTDMPMPPGSSTNDTEMPDVPKEAPKEAPKEPEPEPVPEAVAEEVDPEEAKQKLAQEQATAAKAEGNTLYKQRKFDEAIAKYNEAWELHHDITYLNNRAAAEYEKGDYPTAVATCREAIEYGREVFADYKLLAKAFVRAGTASEKTGNLEDAIEFYNKALTEHRTPDTLNKLRAAEKELKLRESEA